MTAMTSGIDIIPEGFAFVTDDRAPVLERSGSDRELPIANFDEMSVRAARIRLDGLSEDQLRRLRAYESEHKQRKTLIHQIDRRLRV